ncbi:MAG: DUF5011 domain-containing protein [Bacilli bacterium]|nr:DUF5011 domain-containing protein [Bacilli bacterium]
MNKKGFSTIELLVSFIIISFISTAMFKSVLLLNDKLYNYINTSAVLVYNGNAINYIQDDLKGKVITSTTSCGTNCYTIAFDNGESKTLKIDNTTKVLQYGGFSKKLPNNTSFDLDTDQLEVSNTLYTVGATAKTNSILNINIPIISDVITGEYDINIIYQYFSNANSDAPVITMNGASSITINTADVYVDAGASAVDYDKIKLAVTSSSTVNTSTSGTYSVIYTATDSNNRSTSVTRTVIVQPLSAVQAIVVAGGGGGAATGSGGGGGAVLYLISTPLTKGTYTITVGDGGAGGIAGTTWNGANGGNSVFGTTIAYGGGGGVTHGSASAQSGGNGGGAAITTTGSAVIGGTGTFGYKGGNGYVDAGWVGTSGGGGGAGGAGVAGGNTAGSGNGGVGTTTNLLGTTYVFSGGGGGGEVQGSYVGTGGSGVGGTAVINGTGGNGVTNTGSGGAGGGYNGSYFNGGNGGSGIIIITYQGPTRATGGTITHYNGYTMHKYTTVGTFSFVVW